jgi:hypothetical protein
MMQVEREDSFAKPKCNPNSGDAGNPDSIGAWLHLGMVR